MPANHIPPPAAGGNGPGADRFFFFGVFLKKRRSGQERGGQRPGQPCGAPGSGAERAGPVSGWPRCPAGRPGLGSPQPGGGPAALCAGSTLCGRDVPPGAGERGDECVTLCNTVGRIFLPRGTHRGRAGRCHKTRSPSLSLAGAKSEILVAVGFVSLFCFVLFGAFPSFKR